MNRGTSTTRIAGAVLVASSASWALLEGVAAAQTDADVETRSRGWVWVIAAGIVLALALAAVVMRALVRSLPSDVGGPVRAAVGRNVGPLVGGTAVLVVTAVFALYSMSEPIVANGRNSSDQSLGAGEGVDPATGLPATTVDEASGGPASPGDEATGGGPGAPGATSATSAGGGAQPSGTTERPIAEVPLYSGADNLRGISDQSISLCGHLPLSYGAVFNSKPEDALVYWRYLNDRGGINGREVKVSLEDDQYTAEGAVPAATRCAERDPFLIFSGLGSDVIPPVRVWAEQQRELYLTGATIRKGSENLRYSYTATIAVEDLATVTADVINDRFAGRKVGIVWRNSSNFEVSRNAFNKRIKSAGGTIVADLPVQKNQGTYTQEIIALDRAGAEVVFILDDALSQINIIKQAGTQQYRPQWMVFAFNIQTKTLGEDSLNPPLMGTSLGPAYACGQRGGPYASYGANIAEFEAAYAKYSPNTDLCGIAGDLAWQAWVGFQQIGGLLEACGPDCTRNRFAGVMEAGYHGTIGASCPLDFRGNPHHGQFRADVFEAYRGPGNAPAWRNPERCRKAD